MELSWSEIALIVTSVVLVLSGGYIRRLIKEVKELVDLVLYALEDDDISKEELADIIREAKDVKMAITEIIKTFVRR